ncbi:hypothetical protein I601_1511 [Nocardioides dokdonensis FR1436]|uniref:Uncharacterized protein n=1 Tax=Nocardioides dokdonensis FR1436 TaxID=1300347 RepID=A0A1A9GIP1_9ACTN|nr:hypothetical protein [Nocardioides dokdonensis]ANH37946.1 hypothetical protein I601_1511 [Nocardioides dokdonensis FR1436]
MRPRLVVALVVVAVTGFLAWGPAGLAWQDQPTGPGSISDVTLGPEPGTPPSAARWGAGVVDSAGDRPRGRSRPVPRVRRSTYAAAALRATRPGTVSVVGAARGRRLAGVGAVVDDDDVRVLADLSEPGRSRTVAALIDTDALALSVLALGSRPDRSSAVADVERDAGRLALHPGVVDLVEVWAPLRPDLVPLVQGRDRRGRAPARSVAASRAGRGEAVDAAPGSRTWRQVVARTVDELYAALDAGRAPVSPALLADLSPAGLLHADTARLTARGAAYAVAARAVQPGSRALAVNVGGDGLTARAFARPGGGTTVLLHRTGPVRAAFLQVPDGRRVATVRVELAPGALTAVVLDPR